MDKNTFILPNKMRDPFLFEEVLNRQEELLTGNGMLDLSDVSFVEPHSILCLLLLGRNYLRSKGEKIQLVNIPIAVHQYLGRMDFFAANIFNIRTPLNEKYMLKRSSFSSRVIEITEIPNKERKSIAVINSVIALFRKRASFILKYWMNESVVDYFVTVISELCQNIFEHSLDSGYLSMQTYSYANENIFRFAIADSGIGIKESFAAREDLKSRTNAELIEMALTQPISSKREFGFGLCQVNTIIKIMKGSIYIRSGDSAVTAMYHNAKSDSSVIFLKDGLTDFNGTQISISLFA